MTTRIALAGLGDIGLRAHLPALLRAEAASPGGPELAMLVDPDPERRKLAAELAPGVPVAGDLTEALADDSINAVVLATPPWVTTGLIRTTLGAGRYVLAEKPVATSLAEARTLALVVGVERLQVGFTYRHDPAMETLRDWIAEGRLGGPLLVRAHIYDEQRDSQDPEHAARVDVALRHGSPVLHDGAHLFDWLTFLLGEPRPRLDDAWAMRTDPDAASPNLTGARLTYLCGTTVLAEVGWWADRLPRCEMSLLGDRGHAVLDCRTFRLTLETENRTEVVDPPGERTQRCFDRQLARFCAYISAARGAPPKAVPGLPEALASLELSERIARVASVDGGRRAGKERASVDGGRRAGREAASVDGSRRAGNDRNAQ